MRCKQLNKTRLRILELIVNRPHFRAKDMERAGAFITDMAITMQSSLWINQGFKLADDYPEIFDKIFKCNISILQLTLKNDGLARKLLAYNGRG